MLDLRAAVFAPYRPQNIINAVILPGIVLLIFAGSFTLIARALAPVPYWWWEYHTEHQLVTVMLAVIAFLVYTLITIIHSGFLWTFATRWFKDGYDEAKAPSWTSEFGQFVKPGLFLYGYGLITYVILGGVGFSGVTLISSMVGQNEWLATMLSFLLILVLFFVALALLPFWLSTIFQTAREQKLISLFDFSQAFLMAKANYKSVIIALLLCIIVGVLYGVAFFFASIITLGILCPFILYLALTSMTMLLSQAYWDKA